MREMDEKAQEMDEKKPKIQEKPKKKIPKTKPAQIAVKSLEGIEIPDDLQITLDEWEFDSKGQRKDIISLLSSMHRVLPDCAVERWKAIGLSDLLNETAVKRGYRKAVRVVHPDKCIQNKYDDLAKMICNQIFQALEQAWSRE